MSLVYLHIIESLTQGRTAANLEHIIETFNSHRILGLILILTLFFVYRVSSLAPKLHLVFCGYIFFNSFEVFFHSFNKVILTLNFMYVAVSFITYILLKTELKESIYVPGFHKKSISKFSEYDLKAKIEDSFGKEIEGYLTNWGPTGCFFMPLEEIIVRGVVQVKMKFGEKEFNSFGKIMTKYGEGYGISINPKRGKKSHSLLGWEEYYDIINQRGYAPRNQ